jgi:non-ribosomal peptide synthetase component F
MSFGRTLDPERLLHRAFLQQAESSPDASAVICGHRVLSYGEIRRYADDLAIRLHAARVKASTPVAVVMESGWETLVAAFGVLMAGGAYAPINILTVGTDLGRRLSDVGADVVVTQPGLVGRYDFGKKRRVLTVERALTQPAGAGVDIGTARSGQLACVMLRREPRGTYRRVKVTHAQLAKVVRDFGKQTRMDSQDRLVSLDAFDSEAFTGCVFSTLAVGGTVVLPLTEELNDPARWLELVDDYDVTVWSSTPTAMQRLVIAGAAHPAFSLSTLRLAALDCEWMPVRLPAEIERAMPGARVAAFYTDLDDAAEPGRRLELLEPVWTSGLYRLRQTVGQDFAQRFHVLSGGLEDCAPLVPGDLYVGSPATSVTKWPYAVPNRSSSVKRPNGGESLVRTGYRARLRPDGGIEFAPWLDRKTFSAPETPPVWWARARA